MAKIIRIAAAFFWLVTTGVLVYLGYSILQTEANPQALWGWLVMCALAFISVSFLAYIAFFGGRHDAAEHTED
ncbi:MAG TPA: hypothetical protein PKI19_10950 [Elusimicrobiales bacterium]|nr:hypothetical protein [Elusimicrobiales bacterium]